MQAMSQLNLNLVHTKKTIQRSPLIAVKWEFIKCIASVQASGLTIFRPLLHFQVQLRLCMHVRFVCVCVQCALSMSNGKMHPSNACGNNNFTIDFIQYG